MLGIWEVTNKMFYIQDTYENINIWTKYFSFTLSIIITNIKICMYSTNQYQ